jgi:muramoyltetrapeptide carboxypeptidase
MPPSTSMLPMSQAAQVGSRRIELIAPSGYPANPANAVLAIGRLEQAGHRVGNQTCIGRQALRFAGSDSERAADLNRLADPAYALPDIALAIRGGYGAIRLLPLLDYDGLAARLRTSPVALVGHSDFSAIQLALLARSGLISFGGPMLCGDFGAENPSDFTQDAFWRCLTRPELRLSIDAPQLHKIDVSGTLWGGNLAMLVALLGTPYFPEIEAGILFIEDVNEPPFRVERMLYQLHLAGVLARQQAVLVGTFSGVKPAPYDAGFDLDAVLAQMRSVSGIPFITGLPFGHVPDLVTLPMGAPARLRSDSTGFELEVSGYPYLS